MSESREAVRDGPWRTAVHGRGSVSTNGGRQPLVPCRDVRTLAHATHVHLRPPPVSAHFPSPPSLATAGVVAVVLEYMDLRGLDSVLAGVPGHAVPERALAGIAFQVRARRQRLHRGER